MLELPLPPSSTKLSRLYLECADVKIPLSSSVSVGEERLLFSSASSFSSLTIISSSSVSSTLSSWVMAGKAAFLLAKRRLLPPPLPTSMACLFDDLSIAKQSRSERGDDKESSFSGLGAAGLIFATHFL